MDNGKTGGLIRRLRKEKNMTQRDLARVLHVTDQAVSKWERGLCAPDLTLMEPLARTLDVSILELIKGEQTGEPENKWEREEDARIVIDYSQKEITQKVGDARRRYLGLFAAVLSVIVLVSLFFLLRSGRLFVLDRSPSPDGNSLATVYSKALSGRGFSMKDAVSLIVDLGKNKGICRITYGECTYQGLWWAPGSRKYVLSLNDKDGIRLTLADWDRNCETNLSAVLTFGVETTELSKYGYADEEGWPDIEYQFLQWGKDSASMLLYYSFEDGEKAVHEGYFWYNCEDGTIRGILEME